MVLADELSPAVEKERKVIIRPDIEERREEDKEAMEGVVTMTAPPGKMVFDFTYLDAKYAETVVEIPERTPQEGDKAISDLPELAVDEDGNVMQLVGHAYVLALLKSPPRTRRLRDLSVDDIRRGTGITDEEVLENVVASRRATQRLTDINHDIIRQYLDKGYAYIALPLDAPRYPLDPEARNLLPPLP